MELRRARAGGGGQQRKHRPAPAVRRGVHRHQRDGGPTVRGLGVQRRHTLVHVRQRHSRGVGGQHDATAWATSFAAGMIQMYAANFTAPFQMQYSAVSSSTTGSSNGAVNVVYPARAHTTCTSTLQSATAAEVVLGVLLALDTLAVVVLLVVFRSTHISAAVGFHVGRSDRWQRPPRSCGACKLRSRRCWRRGRP